MVTKIILVRHCQSEGNAQNRFQGRVDAPASPDGRKQAELVGLRFRNETLQAIYSSPLSRAVTTAQAIAQYHPLELTLLDALAEIDVGELENMPLDQVASQYPALAYQWSKTPDLCVFPGGESLAQVYSRVSGVLEQLRERHEGETVVLVTHGGVIRTLLAYVRGSIEKLREATVSANTSVTVVEHDEKGYRIALLNDITHLPKTLCAFTNYDLTNRGEGTET